MKLKKIIDRYVASSRTACSIIKNEFPSRIGFWYIKGNNIKQGFSVEETCEHEIYGPYNNNRKNGIWTWNYDYNNERKSILNTWKNGRISGMIIKID